jgi:hypothetical protein
MRNASVFSVDEKLLSMRGKTISESSMCHHINIEVESLHLPRSCCQHASRGFHPKMSESGKGSCVAWSVLPRHAVIRARLSSLTHECARAWRTGWSICTKGSLLAFGELPRRGVEISLGGLPSYPRHSVGDS